MRFRKDSDGNEHFDATPRQDAEDRSRTDTDPFANSLKIATGQDTFPPEWASAQTGEGASIEVPDLVGEVVGFRFFDCTTGAAQPRQLHGGAMDIPSDDGLLTTQYRSRKFSTDLDNHRLVSPYQQYRWEKGVDTAKRMTAEEGGFYAYHDLTHMGGPGNIARIQFQAAMWKIPAVMQAWGEIYVYETGFRAKHVRLVILAFCEDWAWRDVQNYRKWARDTYDCSICPEAELLNASKKFGEPVAQHLRPKNR